MFYMVSQLTCLNGLVEYKERNMANANIAGIKQISDGGADGVKIGQSATDLISTYGVTPVAQAATIAAATSSVTTTSFNSMLTALKNFGIIAV